jgi:predicted  nucleic acid-binding Zn-ribbon protein
MKDLQARLLKAEDTINKHEKDIQELQERGNGKEGQSSAPSSGKGEKDLDELKRDLRDKLEIINRKISNLQSDSDNHEQ